MFNRKFILVNNPRATDSKRVLVSTEFKQIIMINCDQLCLEFVQLPLQVDKGNGLIEIVQLRLFRWLRMSLTISFGVATHGRRMYRQPVTPTTLTVLSHIHIVCMK